MASHVKQGSQFRIAEPDFLRRRNNPIIATPPTEALIPGSGTTAPSTGKSLSGVAPIPATDRRKAEIGELLESSGQADKIVRREEWQRG